MTEANPIRTGADGAETWRARSGPARIVKQGQTSGRWPMDTIESRSESVVGTFPTSINQQRAWFMEQIHPGNRGLNIAVRWELRGPVTSDAVEAAFQKIVKRHEVFRTRFVERDGAPVQEVLDRCEFRLNRLDLRQVPEADRDRKIAEIAIEHAEEPFDLGAGCLLRVAMVQLERHRAGLLISVHNSVFDGYSIGVLGHELGSHLEAMEQGRSIELAELELQYGDYAMWQADYEADGGFVEEIEYWKRTLDGLRYFEFPSDRPRKAGEPEARSLATDLPEDFETRLAETAKALETSVFALGTAAFSIALARFCGRRDVSFAIQVAGRNDVDLEPLIGLFTNPLVMRLDVDPEATLADQARATRDVVNGALAHQTLPFDKLVQAVNPPRDPLRIPLVSIMFNLQRAFLKERRYGSVDLVSVPSHSPGTLYDLNVNIVGRNTGWRMVIDYNAALFDEARIRRFSDLLVDVFDGLMHRVDTSVGAIRSEAETAPEPALAPVARDGGQGAAEMTPEAPADGLARLCGIWAGVLALPPEQVSGNFFDLGGYSVLALRMLAEVGESFGQRPSLHAFLADPTLDGLAGLLALDAAGAPADTASDEAPDPASDPASGTAPAPIWELVELRPASAGAPVLITVNQPLMWHALAREMGSDCAVANLSVPGHAQLKALEAAGLDGGVEDALGPVLERYAGRPMLFCGLCVDGRVALRLAQRLQAEGQDTQCVAMIDSWAPGAIKAFSGFAKWRNNWRIRLRRFGYYLSLRRQGEITWSDLLRQNDVAAGIMARLSGGSARTAAETLVDDTVDVLVAQTKAHDFAPYDGEAVLFVTRSQGMLPADGVMGWSQVLSADTAVYPVNGWHGDALMRSGFDRIMGVLDAKAARLSRSG